MLSTSCGISGRQELVRTYTFPCGCSFPIISQSADGVMPLLEIDHENLPRSCPATWELLGKGLTKGIFQLESPLGRQWTKKLKPESLDHMSALGAILRPGTLRAVDENGVSLTQHYCRRKNNEEPVASYHPAIDPILATTYGVMVYQEQAMAISSTVAGFTDIEADILRKCVTGDTRFLSKQRGWISINTLLASGYADDQFLIMDGAGNSGWKHLEKIWSTGKKTVHSVTTRSGFTVRATGHHQFLTDDGWKARMRLKPQEDYMVTARRVDFEGTDKYSLDECMVIAGMISEGHIVDVPRRNATFVNYDNGFMDTFVKHFNGLFGVPPTMDSDGRVARLTSAQKKYLQTRMTFGLSDRKCIPEEMMGATKPVMAKFVSFLLGAEGGCCIGNGQFEFSSKSIKLVRQMKLLLLRFGIRSNIMMKMIPGYEHPYWRLYVNNLVDQQLMLAELTSEWPSSKKADLETICSNKSCKNFTTDIIPQTIVTRFLNQYPAAGNYESGTIFTSSLSRDRFLRIAEKSFDDYWKRIATGPHEFDLLDTIDNPQKEVETFDFTVAGGDTPYIVADGMVIHNSIGKKLPEEMAKCRKLFIDGAKKQGVVSGEMAEELFGWIEESQKYQFNASHSYCYGETGYDCAYLKAHFPVAFFVSWLDQAKNKQDPREEIFELVNDAKLFDINVLPPDLRELATRFHSEDRKSITFGLADVKGVGAAQLEKLLKAVAETEKELGKPIREWSWNEFLTRCSSKITVSIVDRLIKVGALRWLPKSRQAMLAELEAWNNLTDREQIWYCTLEDIASERVTVEEAAGKPIYEPWWDGKGWLEDKQMVDPKEVWSAMSEKEREKEKKKYDKAFEKKVEANSELCAVIASNASVFTQLSDGLRAVAKPKQEGGVATKARTQIILGHADILDKPLTSMNDSPVWVSWVEEDLLGISLSCSKIDACDVSQVNTTCKEILSGREGFLMIGVEVQRVKEVKTKKGKSPGKKMAFMTVSDGTCCLEMVCFPEGWKEFGHILNEGNLAIIQVERSDSDSFVVKRAWQANQLS